jgi:hypothetical protein
LWPQDLVVGNQRGKPVHSRLNIQNKGKDILMKPHRVCGQKMENIHDVNVFVHPHLQGDLKEISKWAKEDLFAICKFQYQKGDLGPKGKIYKLFVGQCMDRLSGVKATSDEMTKQFYAKIVWETACKENLIASALNLRRSGVYTVMQNRFKGTCRLLVRCDDHF